jgi:hypothetical protein
MDFTTEKIDEIVRKQMEQMKAEEKAKKEGKSVSVAKKEMKDEKPKVQKHVAFMKKERRVVESRPIKSVEEIVNRQVHLFDWQTYHEDSVKRERLNWKNPRNSPHVSQTWLVADGKYYRSEAAKTYDRIIKNDAPRQGYRRRTSEHKSVVHWTERRLLLEAVEFLTTIKKDRLIKRKKEREIVLYSGAAPGHHVNLLSAWFRSDFNFVVFDHRKFELTTRENLTIRQEPFTDKTAREYENKGVIFICNTKFADQHHYDEDGIKNDMNLQRMWCEILRPRIALLDFRVSWNKGKTEFFPGKLRYPIWGHPSGTDCRIEVEFPLKKKKDNDDGDDAMITYEMPSMVMYDHSIHEERMFHFNTIARVQLYRHGIKPDGVTRTLDHCYDCMSEIRVIHRYIETMEQRKVDVSRARTMSELITEHCQKGSENAGKSLEVHVPDISRQRGGGGRRRYHQNNSGGGNRRRGGYHQNHHRHHHHHNNHNKNTNNKRRRQY